MATAPLVIVIMGVAGSGKTTIGRKLAAALGWEFRDADEFHPAANIARMASGHPLTDADRQPWLAAIRTYVESRLASGQRAVITCSALREAYRKVIIVDPLRVKLVHLAGDYALILDRLTRRQGHFMKPQMLQSQFDTLETPHDALAVDIAQSPEAIVSQIRQTFAV